LYFPEAHGTDFAIENNICRLNIHKSRSSALENDNKATRQVHKRGREKDIQGNDLEFLLAGWLHQ